MRERERDPNEYYDHPYDPELCHYLRNPEEFDLKTSDPVKAHIDIYDLQLRDEERAAARRSVQSDTDSQSSDSGDSESEDIFISKKKKIIDWRKTLRELDEVDRELVDRAKYIAPDVDEEEAREEEELFLESEKKRLNKKTVKTSEFVLLEAREAKEEEEENCGESVEKNKFEDAEKKKYSSLQPPEPLTGLGGRVPGGPLKFYDYSSDMINDKVRSMEFEERVERLLVECLDWTKEVNAETLETANEERKFCSHETDEDFEKRKEIFSKANPAAKSSALTQFAMYILQPKFQNSVFLGMYSSGFDNHFVFSELVKLGVRVEPVYRGNKLLTFKIPSLNIKFLDFFCFVPSSLKNLEKSFNLNTGSKGYFPHLLNHPKHYGLNLPHLPPKHFYEPELMKSNDLEAFEKWYSENYNTGFKFSQEILTYCELDVKILLAATLTFIRETLVQQSEFKGRKRKLKPNGTEFEFEPFYRNGEKIIPKLEPNLVHPFSRDVCTLSSYANFLFRSFYLPEKYMPIITHDVEESYSARSSKEEIEYLTYLKEVDQMPDLEFGNEWRGQRRFTVTCPETEKCHTYYVDGYSPTKKVKKFFL
jgi:DNA polymerase type B, organellar and viral